MASPSTATVEGRSHGLIGSIRIAARIAALLTTLVVLMPVHFLCRLLHIPVWIPRHFLGRVAWIVGARVRTIGNPLRRDVVFISNHVSWIDIPALAGTTGSAFVSKAELRAAPVVGWLSTLNHTLFVERDDRMGVAKTDRPASRCAGRIVVSDDLSRGDDERRLRLAAIQGRAARGA